MFDARDLLGKLMQSDLAKSLNERLGGALDPKGTAAGSGGASGDVLGGPAGGKGLNDIAASAGDLYGRGKEAVKAGNPWAVGGVGAVLGGLLGGAGGAVRGGLLAVLGTVAWKAMKDRGLLGAEAVPPPALDEPASAAEQAALQNKAILVIRAMINAAKADGQIDEDERARILDRLNEAGASEEERAFVLAEMQKPMETEAIVAAVGDPGTAMEVYSASLLAIKVDTPAERGYLQSLAQALKLDPATLASIHETLGVPV